MEPRTTLRGLMRHVPYRWLWVARTVSQWGDAFNTVALALLVYSLTGTGLGVSGLVFAEVVPVLLLGPVAGAVVDRLPRVRVMMVADLTRAGLAFTLPLFESHVVWVYAVAVGLSAGAVFFNPAAQSVLPAIVRERDLVTANSGLWTAAVMSQVVLAPLAGVVVAVSGFAWAFWINAASYLFSAAALRHLSVPTTPGTAVGASTPGADRLSWYADARAGMTTIGGHGDLDHLTVSRIDPDEATRTYRERVLATRGAHLDGQGRAGLAEDLRSPCTEEVAVFQAFSRVINESTRRFVVLDTAPTGHTLLLLDATGSYHREIARQMGERTNYTTPLMRLRDPDNTKVILVTLAEQTPVLEAASLQADLERAGIRPWAWVINNSLTAARPTSPLLQQRAVAEAREIDTVIRQHADRFAVVAVLADEPVGVQALLALSASPTRVG